MSLRLFLNSDSACSTSIMRAVVSFRLFGVTDQTWELVPLAYWSFVPLPHPHPHPHLPLSLRIPSDAEIASGLICVSVPVLPQLIRRLPPAIKSMFGTYHRSSSSSSHGSKHFKVPCGGARYKQRTTDGQLAGSDPYHDLHSPRCDYLEMDGHSRSEEKSRDGFTEGGMSVRDVETGLGLHT